MSGVAVVSWPRVGSLARPWLAGAKTTGHAWIFPCISGSVLV